MNGLVVLQGYDLDTFICCTSGPTISFGNISNVRVELISSSFFSVLSSACSFTSYSIALHLHGNCSPVDVAHPEIVVVIYKATSFKNSVSLLYRNPHNGSRWVSNRDLETSPVNSVGTAW